MSNDPKYAVVVRRLTRACEEVENFKGMGVHDGRMQCQVADIRYLLKALEGAQASLAAMKDWQPCRGPHRHCGCPLDNY